MVYSSLGEGCSMKKWNAGLYLRLSRDDEKFESESISSQREILNKFVIANEDIRIYDFYVDDGYTGTNFDRPDFKRMENDLRQKKINCIIVKDLSRFARNCSEIGNYLSVVFPYLKTRFICINDNVDSYLDPESLDNLSTKFKNLINEEYCHDISVKCKSSLTVRREAGEYIGSFPSYGYMKDPNNYHKLLIDDESAETVRLIFRKFLSGDSVRSIVRFLNSENILPPALYKKAKYKRYNFKSYKEIVWTQRTVSRILTNQMYVGDMVQNVMHNVSYRMQICRPVEKEKWIIVPNTHEPIIGRDDFDKAASLLKRDRRTSPKTSELGLFSGFIKCGDCKRAMIKKTVNNGFKTYNYYICSTFKSNGKNFCTKHTISAEKVEAAVLAFLQTNIRLSVEIAPLLELINKNSKRNSVSERLQLQLKSLNDEYQKFLFLKRELYPDYKAGLIDFNEYAEFKNNYEKKLLEIDNSIRNIEAKIAEYAVGDLTENKFIREFKKYNCITELSRGVVCALIDNIYVYEGDRIEISLKYRDDFEFLFDHIYNNSELIASLNSSQKEILSKWMAV